MLQSSFVEYTYRQQQTIALVSAFSTYTNDPHPLVAKANAFADALRDTESTPAGFPSDAQEPTTLHSPYWSKEQLAIIDQTRQAWLDHLATHNPLALAQIPAILEKLVSQLGLDYQTIVASLSTQSASAL